MSQISAIANREACAAAVETALHEVASASTPAAALVAKAHLKQATDRLIAANVRVMTSGALSTGGIGLPHLSSHYTKLIDLAKTALTSTGFAPSGHIACPNHVSPETRYRAILSRIHTNLASMRHQIEGVLRNMATTSSANAAQAGQADPDLLAIIDNPNLSIEEKIALFLAKYVEKNNAELEQKMKELAAAKSGNAQGANASQQAGSTTQAGAASESGSTEGTTAPKHGGGIGAKIKSFFSKFGKVLPKLTAVAGSVLGSMYGPMGSALGAALGGLLGKGLGKLMGAKSDSASSTQESQAQAGTQQAAQAGQTGQTENADKANQAGQADQAKAKDTTTLETELQLLVQKRERLVKLLSDLMATLHQTNMAVVNNIKG